MDKRDRLGDLSKKLMQKREPKVVPQSPREAPRIRPPGSSERRFEGDARTPTTPLPFSPPQEQPYRNSVAREIAARAAAQSFLYKPYRMADDVGSRPAPYYGMVGAERAGVPVGTDEYWKWRMRGQYPRTFFGNKSNSVGFAQA